MRDELSLLEAQLVYKKRLTAMLEQLRSQEAALHQKVLQLEEQTQLEKKDVTRLEKRSLAAFVYYALGKKEEKLDQERREYYAARIKYDAASRELDAIRQDLAATEEDLQDLADCEARYARALEEKRQLLSAADTDSSRVLREKDRLLAGMHAQERELTEAIDAGTAALRTANAVADDLRSAQDWNVLDLLGGGFLLTAAKQETLDQAQQNIEELQVGLQRFNKELSDVTLRVNLQVNIDSLLKFADSFLDTLLQDTAIPERVAQSLTQINETRDRMLGILRQLQTMLEENRHTQSRLRQELDNMVLNTEI